MSDHRTRDDVESIRRLTTAAPERVTRVSASHQELMEQKSFAHLASRGPRGEPQSHPVWFEYVDDQLRISTGTDRQKYRNIRRDPRVALSILDADDPYRYVGVRGRVVEIEPDPDTAFLDRLTRRYLGLGAYPYEERRAVERVIVHIRPDHVVCG